MSFEEAKEQLMKEHNINEEEFQELWERVKVCFETIVEICKNVADQIRELMDIYLNDIDKSVYPAQRRIYRNIPILRSQVLMNKPKYIRARSCC